MKKLKIHKFKVHSEDHSEKSDDPKSCDKCSKKFANSNELQMHIFKAHSAGSMQDLAKEKTKSVKLIGDDKKGFECEVCDKKFVKEGNLKLHQRKDHGPPPKGI